MSVKIKIVEDDGIVREFVQSYLTEQGYMVSTYKDGSSFKLDINSKADLIILDLSLPDVDGYDLARFIRLKSSTPIIMLTARDSTRERLLGFEVGADDYITKPFAVSELLARIKNILRHMGIKDVTRKIAFGNFGLDMEKMTISTNDSIIKLTKSEFKLFKLLLENKDKPTSKDDIFIALKGRKAKRDERSSDILIMRLKAKLPPSLQIKNIRNQGYIIDFV